MWKRIIAAAVVLVVALTAGIWWFMRNNSVIVVNGSSMSPTLHDRDIAIIKKTPLTVGNIVVVPKPSTWVDGQIGTNEYIVKRVRAMPGDSVTIHNHDLKINGTFIESLIYSHPDCAVSDFSIIIPKGEIFVMGDNFNNSVDSLDQICASNADNFLIPESSIVTTGVLRNRI